MNRQRTFAGIFMLLIVILASVFIGCWFAFDPDSNSHFGIRDDLAQHIIGAYLPIIGGSMISFRDSLFRNLGKKSPVLPGAGILYAYTSFGILVALGGILYIASQPPTVRAKWVIAAVATLWAATVGYVISRFLSEHAQ